MNHAVPNAAFLHGNAAGTSANGPARFTPRQLEVLALLCEGLPNKLICRRLNIASGTVKVHISCIFRELGVSSRLQAVVEAQSSGLPGKTHHGDEVADGRRIRRAAGESCTL
jgi:DNA-binding NarL/FixJ family response regulator